MKSLHIGIIGGGNMGAAIASGLRAHYRVRVCEQDRFRSNFVKRTYHVAVSDLEALLRDCGTLILAVKPQQFDELLARISPQVTSQTRVISIAAGVTTRTIEQAVGGRVRVVRTMPNLPAQVGQAMTAVCAGKYATKLDVAFTKKLFDHLGATMVVAEGQIDAITAVSGSGPAYVFLFIECMQKAARKLGFSDKESALLVKQTLVGSLALFEKQKEDASLLRARVTSKGGTTQAALDVFSAKHIDAIFVEALTAAKKRAGELSK